MINNVIYVVILSAALDLVGPSIPKGAVLLADVVPSFLTKLCAPYFIHAVPYSTRIIIFVALSAGGMLLIALSPGYDPTVGADNPIASKMFGVVLASLSSGGGELSFLGLTHFYGPFSLASWGSGTGAAGLVGAGAYALATTSFGFSVKATLLASACLPALMVVSFFGILPREPLRLGTAKVGYEALLGAEQGEAEYRTVNDDLPGRMGEIQEAEAENAGLLQTMANEPEGVKVASVEPEAFSWKLFKINLNRAKGLFFPL